MSPTAGTASVFHVVFTKNEIPFISNSILTILFLLYLFSSSLLLSLL
ncbi:hypothetical protein M080_1238, partial [Bacteroides fragilis str. 3397 T10]